MFEPYQPQLTSYRKVSACRSLISITKLNLWNLKNLFKELINIKIINIPCSPASAAERIPSKGRKGSAGSERPAISTSYSTRPHSDRWRKVLFGHEGRSPGARFPEISGGGIILNTYEDNNQ